MSLRAKTAKLALDNPGPLREALVRVLTGAKHPTSWERKLRCSGTSCLRIYTLNENLKSAPIDSAARLDLRVSKVKRKPQEYPWTLEASSGSRSRPEVVARGVFKPRDWMPVKDATEIIHKDEVLPYIRKNRAKLIQPYVDKEMALIEKWISRWEGYLEEGRALLAQKELTEQDTGKAYFKLFDVLDLAENWDRSKASQFRKRIDTIRKTIADMAASATEADRLFERAMEYLGQMERARDGLEYSRLTRPYAEVLTKLEKIDPAKADKVQQARKNRGVDGRQW